MVKGDMAKMDAFHNGCLRKICQVFWPNKISNVDLYKKTGCNSAVLEIKCRRLTWLGHVCKKEARMAKDDVATNSDGRAERDGAVVGRGSGLSQEQDLVENHCCGLMSHWGRKG